MMRLALGARRIARVRKGGHTLVVVRPFGDASEGEGFMKIREAIENQFARLAAATSVATGSFRAFGMALFVILAWLALGPIFHFSDGWQLVVNTSTTIVTFLMVFVIQHAQNREMRAVQLKLSELIAAVEGASNRLIDVEELSERELEHLYARYRRLATTAAKLTTGARTTIEDEAEAGAPGVRLPSPRRGI